MEEKVVLSNRKLLTIFGATKVVSSTINQAVVEVGETSILICGNNLEVVKLNLEEKEVEFAGEINSFKYTGKKEKIPLIKRIFK